MAVMPGARSASAASRCGAEGEDGLEPDPTGHSLDKCLIHFRDYTWGAQMFDVTRQKMS